MSDEKERLMDESAATIEPKRDAMDGGFAVVDRERLIEEETRVITPWYKHFMNMFFAPTKMMEECFYHEPPKGMSVGIVGCLLFGALAGYITMLNPIMKDTLRATGIDESMIAQKFEMLKITGSISTAVSAVITAFLTAIVLVIIKAIFRSKGKFKNICTASLCANSMGMAIGCIDAIFQAIVGTSTSVLGLGSLINIEGAGAGLQVAAQTCTLTNLFCLVWLVIGYKVACRTSMAKSIAAVGIMEVLFVACSYGFTSWSQSMMQGMGM